MTSGTTSRHASKTQKLCAETKLTGGRKPTHIKHICYSTLSKRLHKKTWKFTEFCELLPLRLCVWMLKAHKWKDKMRKKSISACSLPHVTDKKNHLQRVPKEMARHKRHDHTPQVYTTSLLFLPLWIQSKSEQQTITFSVVFRPISVSHPQGNGY